MHLLRSDPEVVEAFQYCFAYCAQKYGILVHALVQMENHYHDLFTDPRGKRNEFKWELHMLLARCIKALRGKAGEAMSGPLWDPNRSYGRVWMESDEAVVASASYILANPVAAGLVDRLEDWRGVVSRPEDMLGKAITTSRPACLPDSFPDAVTLRFCVPPAFESRAEWLVEAVSEHLTQRIRGALQERGFTLYEGSEASENSPFDAPMTEPHKDDLKPSFRAVTRAALLRGKKKLIAWRRAYRAAFLAFREGRHSVEWPAGTWWFAKYAGAVVAPVALSPLRYAC
jgi:hypothetical protein